MSRVLEDLVVFLGHLIGFLRQRELWVNLLSLAGITCIVGGVAMVSLVLGMIVLGLALIVCAWRLHNG